MAMVQARIQLLSVHAILLAAVCSAAGPQGGVLSLEDCVRLAMEAPSPVTIASLESGIAREGRTIARADFLPQARFQNGFIYNSPLDRNRDLFSFVALNGIREYQSVLSTILNVDTSGRARAAMARARAGLDASEASRRLARRDLRRAVTAAYYGLLLARRLVDFHEAALGEAADFERRTRALYENGEASMADVQKAVSQKALLEQILNTARLQAQLANQDLASFWTADVTAELALQDVFDDPPPVPDVGSETGDRVATQVLRRPEFSLFEARRRGFQADAAAARAELRPQASVVFQYGLDSNRVAIRDRGSAVFVNLDIPLFDWFRSRSGARQARRRAEQVATVRAIAQRAFAREYHAALERMRSLFGRLSIIERQLQASKENLRLARLLYENGEGLALDVVTAQNQVTQAANSYYAAVAGYFNARADWEVASGR